MPYRIALRSGERPWKIIKKSTNKVVGSAVTKEDAEASIKAIYANENKRRKH
jgi:hypothetical protein